MPLIDGEVAGELARRARSINTGATAALATLIALTDFPSPERAVRNPGTEYHRSAVSDRPRGQRAVAYITPTSASGTSTSEALQPHAPKKPATAGVIDFGVSRKASLDPVQHAGLTTATPRFRAQWAGEGDAVRRVWGLGATLYELLVLAQPFPEGAGSDHAHGYRWTPRPLHALCPDVPQRPQRHLPQGPRRAAGRAVPEPVAAFGDLRRWLQRRGLICTARGHCWPAPARLCPSPPGLGRGKCRLRDRGGGSSPPGRAGEITSTRDEPRQRPRRPPPARNLQREADAHTQARVWNLLEQAH